MPPLAIPDVRPNGIHPMTNAMFTVPNPGNEPVSGFLPGSPERASLQAELARQTANPIEIPLIIGGEEIRTGNTQNVVAPHNHQQAIATAHLAGDAEVSKAIESALAAQRDWMRMPWNERAAIFLRAAELLAGPWRDRINASTMLNQSKTCHQAEIDAACELIDFFRFNAKYMEMICVGEQPPISGDGMWNALEMRPLEGFIYAITPFNFTSIAANLPASPAMLGNVAVWKPSPHALLSNYYTMKLMEEAGLPKGVINFVPGDAKAITTKLLAHQDFAGLHFTGSTQVFRSLWKTIATNMETYRSYPRIVGETGGKDFIVAHPSADADAVRVAMIRGAYEFQGQKCSAASRTYLPRSIWSTIKDQLIEEIDGITMGDVATFSNYMGAVIHEGSYEKCEGYIDRAKAASDANVLAGGDCDRTTGWFVRPTLIEAKTHDYESMREEIFGPINSLFVYDDNDYERILSVCDRTSPYALTGAIFANDRQAIATARDRLVFSAGNFYINDKPTGAVVGQQPFGGARASGTNDKAGSPLNLLRWVNARTIKETFAPATDYRYGFLADD